MNPLLKKLNLKDHRHLLVINAPKSFDEQMLALTELNTDIDVKHIKIYEWVLAFVQTEKEVALVVDQLKGNLSNDPVLWFAYPKKSSKNYDSEISRDQGWQPVYDINYEPVRQVAIDPDWSALRWRPVDRIKSMKRKSAGSEKGKGRIKN